MIEKVKETIRGGKALKDRSVEEGWEVIDACVDRSLLNPKTPENSSLSRTDDARAPPHAFDHSESSSVRRGLLRSGGGREAERTPEKQT